MGSYSTLSIGNYNLYWMKSYVDDVTMTMFTEDDRNEFIEIDEEVDEDDKYTNIQYEVSIKVLKTRLDIMGFNLITLENSFKTSLNKILSIQEEDCSKADLYKYLKNFTFKDYLYAFKKIYDNKIDFFAINGNSSMSFRELEKFKELNLDVKYILDEYEDENYLNDIRFYIRGLIELLNDNDLLSIDLTEIVYAGYYSNKEKIAENLHTNDIKTIIFTEGKYDTEIIKQSMKLLYPEYYKYYSFLDVDGPRLELGASRLISYQKSFISAGITNRTIFIFDNDTEGLKNRNELLKLKNIPNNFIIKTYPDINIAKNYPTLCPTGIELLDVNGKASSIELYLCENILLDNEGKYLPIQWKAYDESMKSFQGGFSSKDKTDIQEQFNKILKDCFKNKKNINKYNFDNIHILLLDIFQSFNYTITN